MYNLNRTLPYPRGVNAILRAIETEFGARACRRGKTLEALVIGGNKLTAQPLQSSQACFPLKSTILPKRAFHLGGAITSF